MSGGQEVSSEISRRAAAGSAWLLLEMCGLQGLSLVFFIVLARMLTPNDFGVVSISFIMIQAFRLLIQDRIPEAIAAKSSASPSDWTTAFWLSAGAGAVSALSLIAAAGLIEGLFRMPGLAPVLRAMSGVVFAFGLCRTHEAWLARNFQFRALAIRGICGSLVGGVVGILWAAFRGGIYALVVQQVVGTLVSLLLLWLTCPWRPDLHLNKTARNEIVSHGLNTMAGGLVSLANQTCDTFLVALYFGPGAAGLYNIAKRLRLSLQLVAVTPISGVVLPAIAASKAIPEQKRQIVRRAYTQMSLFCSPVFLGAMFVSGAAIPAFFGERWAAAVPIFAALAAGGLGQALQACTDAVFITHARPRWMAYISVVETALAVCGFAVLAPLLGPAGVGIAFAAPLAISVPLGASLAMRLVGFSVREWGRMVSPGLLAGLLMLLGLELLSPLLSGFSVPARLAASVASGALLFPLFLCVVNRPAFRNMAEFVRSLFVRPLFVKPPFVPSLLQGRAKVLSPLRDRLGLRRMRGAKQRCRST